MHYIKARKEQELNELVYKMYITDGLRVLGNLNVRYVELIDRNAAAPRKTADEIVVGVKNHLDILGRK